MIEARIKEARFPTVKSLDSFDFPAIPSLNIHQSNGKAHFRPVARRDAFLLRSADTSSLRR